MYPNSLSLKVFVFACFCILVLFPTLAQTQVGQVLKDPNGAEYRYHLIGDLEAANPRKNIPAGQGSCGEPGWISYAITHQLAIDPQLMVACHQITGANSLCGIMSKITMGCGYYLNCPGGNKDLKFIGENVVYRLFVNTEIKEIYIGEFFEGNLVEVNKCYLDTKWFEEDPEPYENPVTTGNPICNEPAPEVKKLDPVAIIIADTTSGNEPLRVEFDGTKSYDPDGGEIQKYQWDFGEVVLTGPKPSYIFQIADTFQVLLTVFDDEEATNTTKSTIIVNPIKDLKQPPVARIFASPIAGTAPFKVSLDGFGSYDPDGGDLEKYEWSQNGEIISLLSTPLPQVYEVPGTYTLYLTVTDDEGDTNRVSQKIMVFEPQEPEPAPDSCWMMIYTVRTCGETPDTVQQVPVRVACPAPPKPQVILADCCCETNNGGIAPQKDSRLQLAGGPIFNRHRGQLSEYSLGGNLQIRYRLGEKRRMAVFVDGTVLPFRRATPLDDRPYKWSTLRDSIDPATGLPLVWYRGTTRGTASLGLGVEITPFPWLYLQMIGSVERTFQQTEISDSRKHPQNQFVGFDLETYYVSYRMGVRKDHLEIYAGFRALQENRPFVLILPVPEGGSHNAGWDKAYVVGLSLYY